MPMPWRPARSLALLLAGALGALAAGAQTGYSILRDTPLQRFNDEDMRRYTAAGRQALDNPVLDQPVAWRNDKTGSSGTATASAGRREGCRLLHIEASHRALKSRNEMHLCPVDGRWKATE